VHQRDGRRSAPCRSTSRVAWPCSVRRTSTWFRLRRGRRLRVDHVRASPTSGWIDRRFGYDDAPLLFDDLFAKKPAYGGVAEALRNARQ
jgi:hypothetical protein